MKLVIIDQKNENQRLDKFLKRYLPNAGSGFLYRMLREKKIKLNNAKSDGSTLLKAGDEIKIFFSDETLLKFMGEIKEENISQTDKNKKIFEASIVLETQDVIIINKPAGMLSQKADKNDISACEYLIDYLMGKGELDKDSLRVYKPSVVNRLDRNTSGLLICAKNLKAAQILTEMIKTRAVKKEYLCLVKGKVEDARTVKAFISKDKGSNTVRVSDKTTTDKSDIKDNCEKIETSFRPLLNKGDSTVLEVDLITGKTHQIRAQLAALGYPLAGDPKYGDKVYNRRLQQEYGLKRQFLHAYRLSFPKNTGLGDSLDSQEIIAPLPEDLKKFVKEIPNIK